MPPGSGPARTGPRDCPSPASDLRFQEDVLSTRHTQWGLSGPRARALRKRIVGKEK